MRKNINKKGFLSICMIFVFIFIMSSNSFATTATCGSYPNDIVPVQQPSGSNWCWAACCEMAGKFYLHYKKPTDSSATTQRDVVYYTFGNYNTSNAGTAQQTADGYMYVGHSKAPYTPVFTTTVTSASNFSFSTMKGFVNLHKPTLAGLRIYNWPSGTYISGHMVVVDGYNDTNSQIRFINPADASYTWIDYTSFKNGFYYFGYSAKFDSSGVYVN